MADPVDIELDEAGSPGERLFDERPTEFIVRDAFVLGAVPLALAGLAGVFGLSWLGYLLMALTVFVACFFRNPPRDIPGDERTVVSPADGRVIAVDEASLPDGTLVPRVGIFLSVFNVHVNRAPVAGRVIGIERGGERFRAAFDSRADRDNVYCAMSLETLQKEIVRVVQITGLIARRIVSHPVAGEWVQRGARYGLIRFGSRVDVYLPPGSVITVTRRQKVRGGSSELGRLPEPTSEGSGASTDPQEDA
ncbi:phosphatidylserine decarboxylase [Myxococcota bacterium]|nr:phosphatidylserine decarboxylase [Myxococcota bacterium]